VTGVMSRGLVEADDAPADRPVGPFQMMSSGYLGALLGGGGPGS
jgi:hypothetical protein